MRRKEDELVKEERKPERLPYVKPMSWVIKMSPLSLLDPSNGHGTMPPHEAEDLAKPCVVWEDWEEED